MQRWRLVMIFWVLSLSCQAGATTRGELHCPVRDGWQETPMECPCEVGWKPTEAQLHEILATHKTWRQQGGLNDPSVPGRAVLCGADLSATWLKGADLGGANLRDASLRYARLESADLSGADLEGADLSAAMLKHAQLILTDLENADLGGADLEGALLISTIVTNAHFAYASLHEALYEPASPPPNGHVEGIEGLASVILSPGKQSGIVQLRELLRDAGLRDLEREATFAIERNKAQDARRLGKPFERLGGLLKLIFFEWTTGWGLYPERALVILLGLMTGLTIVYTVPIAQPPYQSRAQHGIYRIWPSGRLNPQSGATGIADRTRAERLTASWPAAIAWAFYFSMLSAFHIGWRDLNVGTWLSRMQFTEFALRGRGWVRFVSGLQSLISVYLVAMWILTYFGRPFQ